MDNITKQFRYPINKRQRAAYIALLQRTYQTRQTQYTLNDLVKIIADTLQISTNQRQSDFNSHSTDTRKNVIKLLRDIESFVKPVNFCLFNICIYTVDNKPITNFVEFYKLCSSDIYLSAQESKDESFESCDHLSQSSLNISDIERQEIERVTTATILNDDKKQFGVMFTSKCTKYDIVDSLDA